MSPTGDSRQQARRVNWLIVGLFVFGGAIIFRLGQLQISRHDHFTALAAKSHSRKFEVPAKRGEIYIQDRDEKVPLVLNQTMYDVYADPAEIRDKPRTADKLAGILGLDPQKTEAELAADSRYVVLKSRVGKAETDKIRNAKLAGIGLKERQIRTYPEGSLASQMVGFVNAEGKGQYGLEGQLDKKLAGVPGLSQAKTDIQGTPIATAKNFVKQPQDGQSLILTIDRNIQAQVEKYLKEGVETVGAKRGSAIVVDPKTGAVKAMANFPTYDPNNYGSVKDYNVFSNQIVTDAFEPGSGFKVIAMAAGLDAGKVNPQTTYNDTGSVEVGGWTIRNADGNKFGVQTMADVIQKSLNTGVIFVLKQLGGNPDKITPAGKKLFHDYIEKFGFNKKTGIEQSGESAGKVNPPGSHDSNYANMTFGQGLSATVLQMTMAVSAIANGGTLYKPYLVDKTISPEGEETAVRPEAVRSGVISPQTASQLTEMMTKVVDHGSGWQTRIPGYKVAGKTGTAQIPRTDGKGYVEDKNIGSFVGFAPAQNPKFVMMIRIDEPNISGHAETTTVPVFAKIATWLLRYYAVPPTEG